MAITKTTTITAIRYTAETTKASGGPMDEPHALWIDTQVVVDDPGSNDPHFPIKNFNTYRLYQDSDVSGEAQIVQDIWNIIFSTHGISSASSIPKIGNDAARPLPRT
jgi:hypothetical protein